MLIRIYCHIYQWVDFEELIALAIRIKFKLQKLKELIEKEKSNC